MKRTLLYLVLLLTLVGGIYLVFGNKDGFDESETGFTIKDTANIGKIFLADKSGKTILLERTPNGWTVNKDFRAIPSTVNTLLTTLQKQEAKYPVPKSAHNVTIKNLAGTGIKVEVYDRNNKMLSVFYVGGETKDFTGSYMMMEGADQAYVVEIPGFPGYLTPRYSTEFTDWRDRTIFNFPAKEIRSVSVQYPGEPLNSFVLRQDDNGNITGETAPGVIPSGQTVNMRRASLYLTFFEKVYSEGFVNGAESVQGVLDTISKRAIIDVEAKSGRREHLDIYWMPLNRRSKNLLRDAQGIPSSYDADRGYGVLNNYKDTVMVQYQAFDKIFRYAYEFYEKDPDPVSVPK